MTKQQHIPGADKGPHLAMTREARGFSRVAVGEGGKKMAGQEALTNISDLEISVLER